MRHVKVPTGLDLQCKGWQQEGALRMLMNVLDPEVAEKPDDLIVYGGRGKAARNWACYDAIIRELKSLEDDETLLVQSGKPVAVFKTSPYAPRVMMVNAMLVPAWANEETFNDLEARGLTMYEQMTAGSWIYIGTQGILQHTYETYGTIGEKHFGGSLKGKVVLTAGLGGMGGAQPLAIVMNEGVALVVDVDPARIDRRIETGYLDVKCLDLEEAVRRVIKARDAQQPLSVGLTGNAAEIFAAISQGDFKPDVVTDQTPAHDLLLYVPLGFSCQQAEELRKKDQVQLAGKARKSICQHVKAMLKFQDQGSIVIDYGNNIREQAHKGGVQEAFNFPGFVSEYVRPNFCLGKGPFRWVALSGDPNDIYKIDEKVMELFSYNEKLVRWIKMAAQKVKFQGLPARICWLGYGERKTFGLAINQMVREGDLSAPIAIGRDHFDTGSVASPYRETEKMKDGSDAIADWPILNALVNASCGATWVSVHHGGGVGIGYSIHAGQVVIADGTRQADEKISRVLTVDPGLGVIRHADAGYEESEELIEKTDIKKPRV